MVRVAVTGVSGDVGSRVARRLIDAGHEVVGIDIAAPAAHRGLDLDMQIMDIRDTDRLRSVIQGCAIVVHLAFVIDEMADVSRMYEINVMGTQGVFRVAAEVGIGHVVYTSSASAYGASPANDVPLTEESELRADELVYAGQKAEVERWLADFLPTVPRLGATILRPAIVLGSGVENFIIRSLAGPRVPVIGGHEPPLQFVHADDLAEAIVHAVETRMVGPFNVASEGWLSYAEVGAILGRKTVHVPEELAHRLIAQANQRGMRDLPAGSVEYLMHPWVMSIDKIVSTGWQPRHSNRDAVAVLSTEIRDRFVVGPLDVTRSTVRRCAIGAATGAVVVGALALRWLVQRAGNRDGS